MAGFSIFTILAALFALLIYAGIREQEEWDAFRKVHDCKIVGKMDASNGYGLSSKGSMVTTYVPGKTGWACNDGVTYWK